jgi:hypothetical protein
VKKVCETVSQPVSGSTGVPTYHPKLCRRLRSGDHGSRQALARKFPTPIFNGIKLGIVAHLSSQLPQEALNRRVTVQASLDKKKTTITRAKGMEDGSSSRAPV